MKAVFVELPAFERHRSDYLDDAAFARLQAVLMRNPTAGDIIKDTGGLQSSDSPARDAARANAAGFG